MCTTIAVWVRLGCAMANRGQSSGCTSSDSPFGSGTHRLRVHYCTGTSSPTRNLSRSSVFEPGSVCGSSSCAPWRPRAPLGNQLQGGIPTLNAFVRFHSRNLLPCAGTWNWCYPARDAWNRQRLQNRLESAVGAGLPAYWRGILGSRLGRAQLTVQVIFAFYTRLVVKTTAGYPEWANGLCLRFHCCEYLSTLWMGHQTAYSLWRGYQTTIYDRVVLSCLHASLLVKLETSHYYTDWSLFVCARKPSFRLGVHESVIAGSQVEPRQP